MAGLVVYIKKTLSKYVKRIGEEAAFGIFLTIDKALFQSEKDVLLCFVYLPPAGSPFYAQYHFVGIDLLEDHLLNLNINIDSYELLILGDLNIEYLHA